MKRCNSTSLNQRESILKPEEQCVLTGLQAKLVLNSRGLLLRRNERNASHTAESVWRTQALTSWVSDNLNMCYTHLMCFSPEKRLETKSCFTGRPVNSWWTFTSNCYTPMRRFSLSTERNTEHTNCCSCQSDTYTSLMDKQGKLNQTLRATQTAVQHCTSALQTLIHKMSIWREPVTDSL